MGILNSISGAANAINVGGSALSLIGMGKSLIQNKDYMKGIEGFLFDVPLTENITMSSNITSHYIEDNSTMQDHIALNPISITLTGKIGELVYTKEQGLTFLSAIVDRLLPLGILSPKQGLRATKAIADAKQVLSAVESVKKTFNSLSDVFNDKPSLNKQQNAFNKFEEYFNGRARLCIETPWRTYGNMVIESFAADQDKETTEETTFTLTFKQVRFVSTTVNTGTLLGRIKEQISEPLNQGIQAGQKKDDDGLLLKVAKAARWVK
jgi:hypothetical protein